MSNPQDLGTAPEHEPAIEPALARGLLGARQSRRDFLRGVGGAVGVLGAGALLSACGVSGAKKAKPETTLQAKQYWAAQKVTDKVTWASWPPTYQDSDPHNIDHHPSLDIFQRETGIKTTVQDAVTSNAEFFAKIQPSLAAGQYTGYDLAIMSATHELEELKELGYLIPLDHSQMPNFKKYVTTTFKNPVYDPNNQFTAPWQAGTYGIGYNPSKIDRPITSWNDLLDPKFKGKIGMFGNTDDMPAIAMLAAGVDPSTADLAGWKKAAAWLQKQKDAGVVRKYYGQEYISALVRGDLWITTAYSGDIFISNLGGANLRYVIPEEGGGLWTDNQIILKNTPHAEDAMKLIDFYYHPDIATMVTEYISCITPVGGVQQRVRADAAKATGNQRKTLETLAASPQVFPNTDELSKLKRARIPTSAEWPTYLSLFQPIYQS